MLGLSLAEIAVILLVGMLVIGPKELPAVIRACARGLGHVRRYTNEFRKGFEDLAQESGLKEIHDEALTVRPMITDLEGKKQPTYDISSEMADDKKRRDEKAKVAAPEQTEQGE